MTFIASIACNALLARVVYITFIIAIICTCIAHSAFIAHKSQKLHIFILHILTPTRFPCYVLLALSRNPNENPITVKLSIEGHQLHQPGRPQRWSRVLCHSQATRSQTTLLWRQDCKVFFSIYLYLCLVYGYYEVCKRLNEDFAQLDIPPVTGKPSSSLPSPWYWRHHYLDHLRPIFLSAILTVTLPRPGGSS